MFGTVKTILEDGGLMVACIPDRAGDDAAEEAVDSVMIFFLGGGNVSL
jgi:hypothetical protein